MSDGFCDKGGKSRINCYDTTTLGQTSRMCTFENAMLDFSKMRTKERPTSGQSGKAKKGKSRMFERGFLSLDCDVPEHEDQSSADIGYFAVYNPNVQNADEVTCDNYYNGTLIMYSVSAFDLSSPCLLLHKYIDYTHTHTHIYIYIYIYTYYKSQSRSRKVVVPTKEGAARHWRRL